MTEQDERVPTLKELYPKATEDQLAEIDFVMDEQIRIVLDMYDRINADPAEYERFHAALTKRRGGV